MLNGTKEEHDLYVKSMLENVAHDEKVFIMNNRNAFADNAHACAIAFEELQECEEALKALKSTLEDLWNYNRKNMPQEEMLKLYALLSTRAYFLMLEATQVKAVALKAIEQLKDYTEVVVNE
nr:hypothetical protein [uncultured Cellulosilyticum sp.]